MRQTGVEPACYVLLGLPCWGTYPKQSLYKDIIRNVIWWYIAVLEKWTNSHNIALSSQEIVVKEKFRVYLFPHHKLWWYNICKRFVHQDFTLYFKFRSPHFLILFITVMQQDKSSGFSCNYLFQEIKTILWQYSLRIHN